MDISTGFISSLLAIVFIDLVLAGDNAIVIGMAARNLPKHLQKKAIFWGTFGAIGIRAISTVVVVWLLRIPALMIVGGLLLVWIAYNLMTEKKEHTNIAAPSSLRAAIQTIVIADGVMGLDNVMGVAGVAHGNITLVIIGMLITVPIIVWGSTMFIRLIERFPIIIYIGGAILAWTAGRMITGDPLLKTYFTPILALAVDIIVVAAVMGAAIMKKRQHA
ncbi:MAG: TerC family protein [Veillonellaceae bacterium]|jgi:YjbE family integral membrane protein|nr:TerC family protein [Veillonellaceae bacterium]